MCSSTTLNRHPSVSPRLVCARICADGTIEAIDRRDLAGRILTLTIRALLRWPPLTEAEVLAGASGLDREVSWPVTLRVRPPAFEPLGGHELAIVSVDALRLLDERLTLTQLIGRLAERDIAGVVVVGSVDSAAIERANQAGLPLLRLPDHFHFADLAPTISRIIAEQKTHQYQLGLDVQHALTEVSLSGRGLAAVIARIAELGRRAVLLLDDSGEILGRAGEMAEDLGSLLPPIERFAEDARRALEGKAEPRTIRISLEHGASLTTSVVVRENVVGYLVLLAASDDFTDEDQVVLTRGSLVCALELAKQEAVTEAERRLRGDFFDALLEGPVGGSLDGLVDRGQRLGYDPALAYVALAVTPDDPDRSPALVARVAREVGEFITSRRAVGLVAPRRQATVVFLSIGSGAPRVDVRSSDWAGGRASGPMIGADHPETSEKGTGLVAARRFAEELRDYLAGPIGASVSIGLGRSYPGLPGLRTGWREAEQAGQIGRAFFGPGHVTAYGELGVYRLLYAFREGDELASFCTETLSALIAYDEKNGTELLSTLEAFFRCDASLRAAADSLYLHRNSMAYRLRRISEITGLDLDNLEDRFRLQLALKGYRLVQRR